MDYYDSLNMIALISYNVLFPNFVNPLISCSNYEIRISLTYRGIPELSPPGAVCLYKRCSGEKCLLLHINFAKSYHRSCPAFFSKKSLFGRSVTLPLLSGLVTLFRQRLLPIPAFTRLEAAGE
ncbi:hypothetical protein [Saccharibacillus alkalitolerans]|uniref:Uncharacterized protein n=1 Tax=Saccharibacillus alkalitolerans TaxID=2705290 RepID=A0ABX0FDE2_9BACL|nr:hypothetical protein [Saccharibacillus alkalitolerans]NGZ77714.1 hypothetical protein [Saccharibacillus alkalitolerans]